MMRPVPGDGFYDVEAARRGTGPQPPGGATTATADAAAAATVQFTSYPNTFYPPPEAPVDPLPTGPWRWPGRNMPLCFGLMLLGPEVGLALTTLGLIIGCSAVFLALPCWDLRCNVTVRGGLLYSLPYRYRMACPSPRYLQSSSPSSSGTCPVMCWYALYIMASF